MGRLILSIALLLQLGGATPASLIGAHGGPITPTWNVGAANIMVIVGSSLTEGGAGYWGANWAWTTQAVSGDGSISFTVPQTGYHYMCGFSEQHTLGNYNDIDFAAYVEGAGTFSVYESGNSRSGHGNYNAGSVVKVSIESGVAKYYVDNDLRYTGVNASPEATEYVICTLYNQGVGVTVLSTPVMVQ